MKSKETSEWSTYVIYLSDLLYIVLCCMAAAGMQAGVAVTVVVTLLVGGAAACFITNCPPGGKRSGGIMSQLGHVRTVSSYPSLALRGDTLRPRNCCITLVFFPPRYFA